jgi:FAD/FMN-containing dehydrogenase
MNTKLQKDLEEKFGHRVSFRRLERKLYGHDIAAIPDIIKPIIGKTLPDAVVQPENEEELAELVKWARENRVPLTPRGKASSGYGGAVPVKGGVVVDFYRMKKIKNIDAKVMTATVEAGVVWEGLDRELMKQGLTLKLYPSSYPSATVGGWLAQGGAGIGSFESGWLRNNVVGARVVTPGGEVKEYRGDDLDLISDAEGTTGLIGEVTVRVQPNEEMDVIAIGCPDADTLQKGVESIIEKKLPIWSFVFINPRMAELKNEAPLREKRVVLPK